MMKKRLPQSLYLNVSYFLVEPLVKPVVKALVKLLAKHLIELLVQILVQLFFNRIEQHFCFR